MARYNKFSSRKPMSFYKLIFIIFAMAFGLVVLTLGYQGVKSSLELRSKAAQQTVEYKRWDFKETVEGWKGERIAKMGVKDGILTVSLGSGTGNISTSGINVTIPKGNKYLELRMAVKPSSDTTVSLVNSGVAKPVCGPGEKCVNVDEPGDTSSGRGGQRDEHGCSISAGFSWCESKQKCLREWEEKCVKVTPKPPSPNKFVFTITYNIGSGVDSSSKELTVGGIADGKMRDYKLHLAGNISESTINNITITFDRGVVPGDQVRVDSIRLTGAVVRPTPKPTCTQPPPCAAQGCKYAVEGVTYCNPTPTPSERCTSDKDCPAGYICSATPPGGCPVRIVNGIEEHVACARPPKCWLIEPTSTPASCWCPGTKMACPGGDIGLCPESEQTPTPSVGCPEDAKLCPNGEYVGRIGPNCVFAPCPGRLTPTPTPLACYCPGYANMRCPNNDSGLCPEVYATPTSGVTTVTLVCPDDMMRCPNGTVVGRVGPNCVFAPCPVQPTGVRALICSLGFFRYSSWCGR